MRYLITAPAPARRIADGRFALESAYVQHIRDLKRLLGPRFTEIILAMPAMSEDDYRKQCQGMAIVDEAAEGIRLVNPYRDGCTKLEFLLNMPRILRQIWQLTKLSDVIHSNFCYDLYRPMGGWFCLFGKMQKKRVLAIEDIDHRNDAEMNLRMGRWSRRTYLMCKYIYDPIRELCYHGYTHLVDLMLYKEMRQVKDYGKGAPHVKFFLDPNFGAEHVVDDAFVQRKLRSLEDKSRPLRVMYFGRLVPYKGVDKMIEAVALARGRGANITLDIMGTGEQREALELLVKQLGIAEIVSWIAPRPYGPEFFAALHERDILLACPLSGDTPRSAWDALASAMPLVAFDTPFYCSMREYSKAVDVTPWPEVEPLAQRLVELARDKTLLAPSVVQAVRTARENTGEHWMQRRNAWVQELCS
jgi:glycosyltransferase involved in cell wall biosynthesis